METHKYSVTNPVLDHFWDEQKTYQESFCLASTESPGGE